jgi:hypothetical protein
LQSQRKSRTDDLIAVREGAIGRRVYSVDVKKGVEGREVEGELVFFGWEVEVEVKVEVEVELQSEMGMKRGSSGK